MFSRSLPRWIWLAGVAAQLSLLPRIVAETISLQPAADASLIEVEPVNSLGGAGFFNAGTTATGMRTRALLFFDLTGLIPSGADIISVSLSLDVVRQPNSGPESSVFSLRQMLSSWGEGSTLPADPDGSPGRGGPAVLGDATWDHRFFNDVPWSAPGGMEGVDFSATIGSSATVFGTGDLVFFDSTPGLVADVEYWLQHPEMNFGWMLKTEAEDLPRTARSFASRESGYGPTLIIDFVVVPEPAIWWLAGMGAAATWLALRRR